MTQIFLMLEGSPKVRLSNSYILGKYLLDKLSPKKFEKVEIRIIDSYKSKNKLDNLLRAVNDCDYLMLTFPLYFDAPPAIVIKTMDLIAEYRRDKKQDKEQQMIAICNNGYPEPRLSETALDICRIFAKETGFLWNGGVGVAGFTGVVFLESLKKKVESPSLPSFGIKAKKIIKGLNKVVKLLNQDCVITENGKYRLIKQFLPPWLYYRIGHYVWRSHAKKNGTLHRLNDRPYDRAEM